MSSNWNPLEVHRCEECIRPICQCQFNKGSFNGDVDIQLGIKDIAMHDLFSGV